MFHLPQLWCPHTTFMPNSHYAGGGSLHCSQWKASFLTSMAEKRPQIKRGKLRRTPLANEPDVPSHSTDIPSWLQFSPWVPVVSFIPYLHFAFAIRMTIWIWSCLFSGLYISIRHRLTSIEGILPRHLPLVAAFSSMWHVVQYFGSHNWLVIRASAYSWINANYNDHTKLCTLRHKNPFIKRYFSSLILHVMNIISPVHCIFYSHNSSLFLKWYLNGCVGPMHSTFPGISIKPSYHMSSWNIIRSWFLCQAQATWRISNQLWLKV